MEAAFASSDWLEVILYLSAVSSQAVPVVQYILPQ